MFALADVVHLLLDEFTRLRAGSLALALVPPSPLHCLFLWHACLLLRRHSPAHRRPGASLAGRPCNACVTPFCAGIRLLTVDPGRPLRAARATHALHPFAQAFACSPSEVGERRRGALRHASLTP